MDRLVLPSGNELTQLLQGDLATTLFYNTQDVTILIYETFSKETVY